MRAYTSIIKVLCSISTTVEKNYSTTTFTNTSPTTTTTNTTSTGSFGQRAKKNIREKQTQTLFTTAFGIARHFA